MPLPTNFRLKNIQALLLSVFVFASGSILAQDIPEPHTPWELKGAEERIEKHRKGEITLRFELPDGSLISEKVPVLMELSNHEFKFGTAVGQIRGFPDEKSIEKYKKYVGEIFNYANIGVYWVLIEPNKGEKIDPDYIRSSIEWAKEMQMTMRGHPMLWHQSLPRWLFEMTDPEAVDRIIQDHFRYLLAQYPEIEHWDVYNEAVAAYRSHVPENGVVRWVTYKGGVNPAVESLFSLANEIDPERYYVNNHYTHTHPEFKELNQYLIDKGTAPGAIGIQTHMHQKPDQIGETELWEMLEEYAVFGLPLQLSEFTYLSSEPFDNWAAMQEYTKKVSKARKRGKLGPLRPSTPEYEKKQADYLRDFYTLAFSHPSVEAIVYWNASDLSAWRGTASGFLDVNNDPKPAYYVLKKLIREKWHTSVNGTTSERGTIDFKGFYGGYEGTLTHHNRSYVFSFYHSSEQSFKSQTVKLEPSK